MPRGVAKNPQQKSKRMSEARKGRFVGGGFRKGHSPYKGTEKGWFKKGSKVSEEQKRKVSEAQKGNKYNLGKHRSEETKRKISISLSGKNHPNWKGGYENKLMLGRKRRIVKLGNGGSHVLGEWQTLKAQYNWTCPACGKSEPTIKLTEDHIVPVSKGGSDNIENIQPLCKSCNSKKQTKIIRYEILKKGAAVPAEKEIDPDEVPF